MKAFLGAARCDQRSPDPLTGFDSRDNVRMHSLWPAGRRCLFPVINLALNVSARARLAWQERKAEPFVVTPLACGSGSLRIDDKNEPVGAYVEASQYGGLKPERGQEGTGITLGAAMAISGAAVSPNMGYHSSPSAAFLMTLFNLRLGAWLPNPIKWRAQGERDHIARKKNALIPFLRELTGSTGDDTDEVYLSDGGHFENLGLYEMIRRRCRFIFVSDGGCDPNFQFADLGNALRKISIDQRTDIEFRDVRLGARSSPVDGRLAYALATIKYPEGWEGTLLYLKPSVLENLPMDVNAYAIANLAFPHESTADQWYSESQFESYRRLGQFLTEQLGARTVPGTAAPSEWRLSSTALACPNAGMGACRRFSASGSLHWPAWSRRIRGLRASGISLGAMGAAVAPRSEAVIDAPMPRHLRPLALLEAEQLSASAPREHAALSASAGTGKTHVLTRGCFGCCSRGRSFLDPLPHLHQGRRRRDGRPDPSPARLLGEAEGCRARGRVEGAGRGFRAGGAGQGPDPVRPGARRRRRRPQDPDHPCLRPGPARRLPGRGGAGAGLSAARGAGGAIAGPPDPRRHARPGRGARRDGLIEDIQALSHRLGEGGAESSSAVAPGRPTP